MTKKIPLRQCIACQEMKNKKELMRVVKQQDGSICLDLTGKLSGRGAYLCKNRDCLFKAQKVKGLERAFKMPVDGKVYEQLQKEYEESIDR